MTASEKTSRKVPAAGAAARLLRSAFTWLLVFAVFCTSFVLLLPGRSLNAADGVSSTFKVLVTKLAAFLPSQEQPDVVMLGSSLLLVPAVRCDDKMAGKPPCFDRWYYDRYIPEYTQALYLEKHLADEAGLHLKIKNLGVASSIMSDQCGIFKLMLAEGKHPRMVILGIAPRDFLDNTQQKHMETPTALFMREYNESSLLPDEFTPDALLATTGKIEHRFKKVFAGIKTACTNLACEVSKHPGQAELNSQTYSGDRPNELKDIETYRKLYNPPNFRMLAQQTEYLRLLLSDARAHGISVLVINMPLTRENTDSLDQRALEAYRKALASTTQQCGAGFLDIGSSSPEFSTADFEDCCHLNTSGGEKLYSQLVSYINGNARLLAALRGQSANSPAGTNASRISWQKESN